MWEVDIPDIAERQLEKLEKTTQKRIINVLKRIRVRPERFLERMVGEKSYKLRIGDYRVIVDLDYQNSKITVLKIGHRKKIYKK